MIQTIHRKQLLHTDISNAWSFFANPANLNEITPPDLQFSILSTLPNEIYAGQIIVYKLTPIKGITVGWTTEITHVVPQKYFVDEQRFGPYKFWHHQHHFKDVAGGVEMIDIVHYDVGRAFLGNIANHLFVKKRLEQIFDFRENVLKNKFR